MIGAIADDFTGGTDVAVALRRAGLRTVIVFGDPSSVGALPDHDALVVALKTRTIRPAAAVGASTAAVAWLRERGADQIFFKYCSTFDSRSDGNIGPVADALSELLGASRVAVVPSSPEHGRTQYAGHLFVGHQLLSESPMRHHPLTPMTDSFIPRLLAAQTPHSVALVDLDQVREGRERIRARFDETDARYLVVDAVSASDLVEIGAACIDDVLVTGAAGLAGGLGIAQAERMRAVAPTAAPAPSPLPTAGAVLAGSCSARTLEQIAFMRRSHDAYHLDPLALPDPQALADAALAWVDTRNRTDAPLIYSSMPPAELRHVQHVLGVAGASTILETAMGLIAVGLVRRGVRRLVIAGGETSGAVVTALDIGGAVIGAEAAPGVPWIHTSGAQPIALLLKSGNFGDLGLLARSVESDSSKETAA
ncbi:four-carbon acid sugar kinase family protein [Microbacteriaceae bacterium VKM Ac-2854]|nr:four-carbon acid sugar kinase family protein [Microbacteriaceae bacterium VKM Ac-2854]